MPLIAPLRIRFGAFELNTRAGELFKDGFRLKLQGHPVRILAMLLERPGDLVTREEIQQRLWPSEAETFVDFEHGLNNAMRKLRQALGDEAETPKYIETLPRRGYRFIGQIEATRTEEDPAELPQLPVQEPVAENGVASSAIAVKSETTNRRSLWPVLGLFVVIIAGFGGYFLYRVRSRPALTERDTIVVADFTNTTGDTVFIDTLRQGLLVQLSQSPFLNILPDDSVRATLHQMGRQPQEWFSDQLAREVCQRNQSKVFISGSIATLGSEYVLGLKAVNCRTGAIVAQQQTEVARKEDVLTALGDQASVLRRKLGESLAGIQKYDVPLEEATTSSLDALQAYSIGLKQHRAMDYPSAITFYKRSIELDPSFAMAYLMLGRANWNIYRYDIVRQSLAKAYSLRERVTNKEKFEIEAEYYTFGTGELDKAAQVYEFWKTMYPHDAEPYIGLAFVLVDLEPAYSNALEAYRRRPTALTFFNLTWKTLRKGPSPEVQRLLDEGNARGYTALNIRHLHYWLAFMQHDDANMERVVNAAPPGSRLEMTIHNEQSRAEMYYGRLHKARELRRQVIELAKQRQAPQDAGTYLSSAAVFEANIGNYDEARRLAAAGYATDKDEAEIMAMSAIAYARAGELRKAEALAAELAKQYPADTIVSRYWLPTVRASIEISRNNAAETIEILRGSSRYELLTSEVSLELPYTRGLAYLQLKQGSEAAAEFQKIVDHPGIVLTSPVGALAHLGMARAYVLQGDIPKAEAEYGTFLTLWQNADTDIPMYQQAKAEYAKLR